MTLTLREFACNICERLFWIDQSYLDEDGEWDVLHCPHQESFLCMSSAEPEPTGRFLDVEFD